MREELVLEGGRTETCKPRRVWLEVNYCIIQIQSCVLFFCTCVTKCQILMERYVCVCVCAFVFMLAHCKDEKIGCLLLAVLKAYN